MRVLVTGGAGFIGSNFVRLLLDETDHAVVVLDALTYAGHRSTIADVALDPRVRFVHGDVRDRAAVADAVAGCGAVVHFAAESHVDRSIVGPDEFVSTNCGGTNVVCDEARLAGVERVVHIGTDEVYGSVAEGSSLEGDRLDPRSPYSASKAASDLLALAHHTTHGLPVVVTRCSNNFGPWQFPEKVIPLFATNLLDGEPVPLYGDGRHVRDWLHVEDHCRAVLLVLEHGEAGEVYNVGAGNELTNLDLVGRLLALTGRDDSLVTPVADRPGHDRRYSVDAGRIRALGWSPVHALDDALAATVAWYRANEWWWRPLKAGVGAPR